MAALLGTIAAVWILAGCASDRGDGADSAPPADGTTGSPTPTSETASTATDPATDAPAFPRGTGRQIGQGSGGAGLVLVDVRVAGAEDFDRVVLEFSGTGTPGWVVEYVDDAVVDGSGAVVDLGGGAVLDVYASGTTWPAPDYYSGPSHLAPTNGGVVEDVYVGGTFEGSTQVLAGMDGGPSPFRVFALTDPSRLVIDVSHRDVGGPP